MCTAQSVTLTCSRCYGIRPDLCNGLHIRICSANVWNHAYTHNHLHELNSHIKGKAFNIRDLRQRIDTSWRQSGKKHYRSCRRVFCNPRRYLTCCNNHFRQTYEKHCQNNKIQNYFSSDTIFVGKIEIFLFNDKLSMIKN